MGPPAVAQSKGQAGSNRGRVVSWGFPWLLAGKAECGAVGAREGLCQGWVTLVRGGWVWGWG